MSPVQARNAQTEGGQTGNNPNGMTSPSQTSLAQFRKEFFDLVDAIVQSSAVLQADARDLDQETFRKDVHAVHTSGGRLREMAHEFFALAESDEAAEELVRTLRHDMLNALNVIINYCEEWIEDCEEEFLQGFLPDLQQLHGHGKQCLGVLTRIRSAQQGEPGPGDAQEAEAAAMMADALYEMEVGKKDGNEVGEPGLCLVVDDDPKNRDILSRQLLRQGHKVDTAVNGREALEKIRANNFDLVFLDIMMPEMNGFQVLQHLKGDGCLRDLPVIMISALGEIDVVARCISMGAEDYLPKPFNPVLLKARIGACLEKKRFLDREKLYLRQIEQEKKRSDELLHVILPDEIVQELKTTDEVKPRRCHDVAVLFADLVGFTSYCGSHSAEEVVLHLQNLVEAWENSALRHGVEKIKTIGDAFMAAAGLLQKRDNPVLSCIRCGLEMIRTTRELPNVKWELRVGIHIGEVVAGVIGKRQYLFDLWGDTVNTAARMESNGKPGLITLTEDAWKRVSELARFERDQVAAKGKGQMVVYRLGELLRE
jgi:class 3 adenylate cyclase/ActR/RegA family two-component response regulator